MTYSIYLKYNWKEKEYKYLYLSRGIFFYLKVEAKKGSSNMAPFFPCAINVYTYGVLFGSISRFERDLMSKTGSVTILLTCTRVQINQRGKACSFCGK